MINPPEGIRILPDGGLFFENVRIFWPVLMEARAFDDNPDSSKTFQASLGFEKSNPREAAMASWLLQHVEQFAQDNQLGMLPPDRLCVRDGKYNKDEEVRNFWLFSAAERTKPVVLDGACEEVTNAAVVRGGYYVNMVASLWKQNNKWGKRVNANLRAVQLVRRGPVMCEAGGGGGEAAARRAAAAFAPITQPVPGGLALVPDLGMGAD